MLNLKSPCLLSLWQIVLLLFLCNISSGQDIHFTNLNTSNGLSDNFIRSLVVDKEGFLWIGTNEGLNSYDGYLISGYSSDDYPALPKRDIVDLFCDESNQVWISAGDGCTRADQKRVFHKIKLEDSITVFNCFKVVETKKYGVVLITDYGLYYHGGANKKWIKIKTASTLFSFSDLTDVISYDANQLLIVLRDKIILLDLTTEQIIETYPLKDILSVEKLANRKIALANNKGQLQIMDLNTRQIFKTYDFSNYFQPKITYSNWSEVKLAPDSTLLYASLSQGLFAIQGDVVTQFSHDPANSLSIASNRMVRILAAANGIIVAGTERDGVSIFKLDNGAAFYKNKFKDENNHVYDSWLTQIVEAKDHSFWLGAFDRLIHWDKKNNKTRFYFYRDNQTKNPQSNPEIIRIYLDKMGQIWAGVLSVGITIFNPSTGSFKKIPLNTSDSAQRGNLILDFFEASDGSMWVASNSGFYLINPKTHKTISLSNNTIFKEYCTTWTEDIAEDKNQNIWIATRGKGLIKYNLKTKTIKQFTQKDGLLDNDCLELLCSSSNDVYIGSFSGFSIVHADETISTYTKKNGLKYDKSDAFLEDDQAKIWIANAKCLVKFDPVQKSFEVFDESVGLNKGGFKPAGALKSSDGEFLWSTQSGINYFYPNQIKNTIVPLQVHINTIFSGDSTYLVSNSSSKIKYRNNNILFSFVAVNLLGSHNIFYKYKLEGYDKDWQIGVDIRQARYSSLPPGKYSFKVMASTDKKIWYESPQSFLFTIETPYYKQWWFIGLIALLTLSVLLFVIKKRYQVLNRKREELKTQKVINYFSASIYKQQTVDEILWDLTKNCISQLNFEDCVVYLFDEERKVLVQKAAHGPKNTRNFEINKPIDIPIGKGIVGSVAEKLNPEIIEDTSKDSRYIADDEIRYSEITVPIVSEGQLLGVIDCEHSKKRFFTQNHLYILKTLASFCAIKITQAKTDSEKRRAEMMLAETKHKMAEMEMQALRAQMNPHFIFNCLNSINRYIVKSDQATASLYLTRFAKLIRLILDNSRNKNVVLSNELEALRLYIEMEALRFDMKFSYQIEVDENVQADSIEIPPLIIQPYVENAIWHGLLHKPENGNLYIGISMPKPHLLRCIIEDNGIGREKAAALKSQSATTKKSLGMELTESRLMLLNQYAQIRSSVQIEDLKNELNHAAGTRVVLQIPIDND